MFISVPPENITLGRIWVKEEERFCVSLFIPQFIFYIFSRSSRNVFDIFTSETLSNFLHNSLKRKAPLKKTYRLRLQKEIRYLEKHLWNAFSRGGTISEKQVLDCFLLGYICSAVFLETAILNTFWQLQKTSRRSVTLLSFKLGTAVHWSTLFIKFIYLRIYLKLTNLQEYRRHIYIKIARPIG